MRPNYDVSLLVGSDELGWQDLGRSAVLGQMTKAMPGGDGSLEWSLSGDAAWRARNVLVPGAKVRLRANGEPIWGGRYVSDPLRHRLGAPDTIQCAAAGLNAWAARYGGFGWTWLDTDMSHWFRICQRYDPTNGLSDLPDQGKFTIDTEGRLYIRADADRTYQAYSSAALAYWLNGGIDLGNRIYGIMLQYESNTPGNWRITVRAKNSDPWRCAYDGNLEYADSTSRSSWYYPGTLALTEPSQAIVIKLNYNSSTSGSPTSDPWIKVRDVRLFCRGSVGAPDVSASVGEALGDIGTLQGLASVQSVSVGSSDLTQLAYLPDASQTPADVLRAIAAAHDVEVEYGFDLALDGQDRFWAAEKHAVPDPRRNTIWSYGEAPSETPETIKRDPEVAPDYIRLSYLSAGVLGLPDGQPRNVWYPAAPSSYGESVLVVTDYAEMTLTDARAADLAARIWQRRQAQQWKGEAQFGSEATDIGGRRRPSYQVRPGDRLSVPRLEGARDLYVAATSYDWQRLTATASIGWPFDLVLMPGTWGYWRSQG